MTPTEPQTSLQAIELLQEALRGLPVLAVMWYMLRDVRTKVTEMSGEVQAMKLKMAADNNHVRIEHTEEKLKEFKAEARETKEAVHARLTLIEHQLPAIWAKVGDRPEDIQRRNGVQT